MVNFSDFTSDYLGSNFTLVQSTDQTSSTLVKTYMLQNDILFNQSNLWTQRNITYNDADVQLIIDGTGHKINIQQVDFDGLFILGSTNVSNAKPTIIRNFNFVSNVNINSIIGVSTGRIEIVNCKLTLYGNINNNCGGLIYNNLFNSQNANFSLSNCSVTVYGKIGLNAGPLIGYMALNSGSVYSLTNCFATVIDNLSKVGNQTLYSGAGAFVGSGVSNTVNISNSYCIFSGSMGSGSGIIGGKFLSSNGTLTVNNFYAIANITSVVNVSNNIGQTSYILSSYNGGSLFNETSSNLNNVCILNLGSINLPHIYCANNNIYDSLNGINLYTSNTQSYNLFTSNTQSDNLFDANNIAQLLVDYTIINDSTTNTVHLIGPYIDLSNLTLGNLNLTETNLTGANLTEANLTGANLTGANLTEANLTDTNLTWANLTDATLSTSSYITKYELKTSSQPNLSVLTLQHGYSNTVNIKLDPSVAPSFSYKLYYSTTNSYNGSLISDVTTTSYDIPTDKIVDTYYYYKITQISTSDIYTNSYVYSAFFRLNIEPPTPEPPTPEPPIPELTTVNSWIEFINIPTIILLNSSIVFNIYKLNPTLKFGSCVFYSSNFNVAHIDNLGNIIVKGVRGKFYIIATNQHGNIIYTTKYFIEIK